MGKSIKKFKDFKPKKSETKKEEEIEFEKDEKGSTETSNDIEVLNKKVEKTVKLKDKDFEIVSISNVSFDDPRETDEQLKENAIVINAEFGDYKPKRGDHLWITAMVKKNNYSWNSMAVLKVRIVDMYQGLSILNNIRGKK